MSKQQDHRRREESDQGNHDHLLRTYPIFDRTHAECPQRGDDVGDDSEDQHC